ncbi:MAG: MOSC domain-containing protein [Candidatus Kapaibacterium sp.]
MEPKILGIYSTLSSGEEMISREEGELVVERGIVGDRYSVELGTFSKNVDETRDYEVTLIESEEIDRFNAEHGFSIDYGAFRRNIVTQGVRLNQLVGREFRLGDVKLYAVGLCEPCAYLAKVLVPEVLPAMVGRGGLRARIVEGGKIRVGDMIETDLQSNENVGR